MILIILYIFREMCRMKWAIQFSRISASSKLQFSGAFFASYVNAFGRISNVLRKLIKTIPINFQFIDKNTFHTSLRAWTRPCIQFLHSLFFAVRRTQYVHKSSMQEKMNLRNLRSYTECVPVLIMYANIAFGSWAALARTPEQCFMENVNIIILYQETSRCPLKVKRTHPRHGWMNEFTECCSLR